MDPSHTTIVGAGSDPQAPSWPAAPGGAAAGPRPLAGERIGSYRLLELIGEGGFGLVYVAEQEQPVRRRVALKLIKPGMDSAAVIARFEAERQALALMDHPCVARVFDAGTTPYGPGSVGGGRPYFVMEYVPGVPISEFCDRHRYTTRQRLELFIQVCEAVQHAHQKGIIHRDIKPSNVLVMLQRMGDRDVATPKVIDFGVAKAVIQRLTEKTLFTSQGQLVGTPEYMSPEQASGSNLDVDTRSDVYSLGVLLYELLTGSLPFDPEKMRRAALFEIQKMIREVEPQRPSLRLSGAVTKARSDGVTKPERDRAAGEAGADPPSPTPLRHSVTSSLQDIADRRRTDVSSLTRQLRGDLDWITLRAMEKDRAHRYETPSALASDIRRHLSNEPVLAGPPSAVYRLGKFARRNRVALAGAAGIALALVAGLAAASYGFVRASTERDAARTAEAGEREQRAEAVALREAEAVQRRLAEDNAARAGREKAKAQAVNTFLQKMLTNADPNVAQGQEVTVRKVLDDAAQEVDAGSLTAQPEVEAQVRQTLGVTYHRLGLYPQAEGHLRRALALRTEVLGEKAAETAESMTDLGVLLTDTEKLDESEGLFRRALEVRQELFGTESADTAASMNNLATQLHTRGQLEDAEALYRKGLEIQRRVLDSRDPELALSINNLGQLMLAQGRLADAEPLCRESLELRRKVLGDKHPDTAQSLNNLAGLMMGLARYPEAEGLFRESLEIRRSVLGEEHPDVAGCFNNLAGATYMQGKLGEAEDFSRKALDMRRRTLGEKHPQVAVGLINLGRILVDAKKYEDAEGALLESEALLRAMDGAPPGALERARAELAQVYRKWGKPEKAAEWDPKGGG